MQGTTKTSPVAIKERIESIRENGIDVLSRTLYLSGEITNETADVLFKLESLDRASGPITIYLCTGGGDSQVGYAIHDMIASMKNKVTIIGMGSVQSIGAIILQAADTRLLSPNTMFMIHHGSVELESKTQTIDNITMMSRQYAVDNEIYYSILSKRSGLSRKDIVRYCKLERLFTAKEAVECNFADGILEGVKNGNT